MNEQTIGNIETVSDEKFLGIKSTSSPFVESFYFNEIYDDKELNKFIKSVEKLIRTSKEYEDYIASLRANIHSLNHDNILYNITTSDVDLEFHHYPLTLYDIISVVVYSSIARNKNFTTFSIAKEVMQRHSEHIIGLVSLTHTTHELAHSGNLFISKKQIFGNYEKFLNLYKDGVSYDINQKIVNMQKLSDMNIASDFKGIL